MVIGTRPVQARSKRSTSRTKIVAPPTSTSTGYGRKNSPGSITAGIAVICCCRVVQLSRMDCTTRSTSSASTPMKIVALASRKNPPAVLMRVARKPRFESCVSRPLASSLCTTATTSFTDFLKDSHPFRYRLPDPIGQLLGIALGVEAVPALGLRLHKRVIRRTYTCVKGERLCFEAIPLVLGVLACKPDLDWHIEEHRHVWLDPGGGEGYHRGQVVSVEPTTGALVSQRRVGEAIAHHNVAALERGPNNTLNQLSARGIHQERLRARYEMEFEAVEEQSPQFGAERRPARLVCQHNLLASASKAFHEKARLQGFSGALGTFEGNKH